MLPDIILIIHFLFVGFILIGFILIWIGALFKWRWIRNRIFRIIHISAMGLVALESILGVACPLTEWENQLRIESGKSYDGSFVQYWIHKILFYSAPEYVFTLIYVMFTAAMVLTWFAVKPGSFQIKK